VLPPKVGQEVLAWAFDAYFAAYQSVRNSLEQITYEGSEVWIPIPAGFAGMKTFTELEAANSEAKNNETI